MTGTVRPTQQAGPGSQTRQPPGPGARGRRVGRRPVWEAGGPGNLWRPPPAPRAARVPLQDPGQGADRHLGPRLPAGRTSGSRPPTGTPPALWAGVQKGQDKSQRDPGCWEGGVCQTSACTEEAKATRTGKTPRRLPANTRCPRQPSSQAALVMRALPVQAVCSFHGLHSCEKG